MTVERVVEALGKIADLSSGFGHSDDEPDTLLSEIHELACNALAVQGYVRIIYPRSGLLWRERSS